MAGPSFESLLCTEENDGLFDDGDFGAVEEFEALWSHRGGDRSRSSDEAPIGVLPELQSDECLGTMVRTESEHFPGMEYLKRLQSSDSDEVARKEAVHWIGEVHAHFGFGPLCAYLSINYVDRFLAVYEIPAQKGKIWMVQLLAVACLSLAAKLEESEVPQCLDLQVGELKFVFEGKTIQRMELLVLSTLKWRLHAVTPFSFIDSFLEKINGDKIPIRDVILQQSTQLILGTIKAIDFLEFKPSEIAAAVAISVSGETETIDSEKTISVFTPLVDKARVMRCIELIQDTELGTDFREGSVSGLSAPQSPVGVLDAAWLSYNKADDSAVGSCTYNTPQAKRRRLTFEMEV